MMGVHRKARNGIKRSLAGILLVLVLLTGMAGNVCAGETGQSYLYEEGDVVEAPQATEPGRDIDHTVIQTTPMKNPGDLYATENYLYIADTGNNRILKLNKKFELIREYTGYQLEGQEVSFAAPSGIYVDQEESMLIADQQNKRLVKLDQSGGLLAAYEQPDSKLLPETLNYLPSKVVCDEAGRIFVAVSGFNMGLIELDKNGNFVQLLGASKVTYSIGEALWRLVSTKEQQKRMASFVPAEYNNISVDENGFIFATTGTMSQMSEDGLKLVRKLNAKGDDVLIREDPVCGDLSWSSMGSVKGPSQIVDCANLEDGIYAILDAKRGRVFVYDKFGTMLFLFGGLGQTEGTLTTPSSLAVFDGKFLVLDSVKNKVVSFSLTEYAKVLLEACHYREINDFEAEKQAWQKVYHLNNNHPAIMREMGKIAYRQRDMKGAMMMFEEAQAQGLYSKAFQFYRRDMINQYFNLFGIGLIAVIILWNVGKLFFRHYRKKHPKPVKKAGPLRYAGYVIFRPLDGFWDLKHEKRGSLKVAIGMIAAAGAALVFQSLVTGFIFNNRDLKYYNFIWDLLAVFAPVLLWVICTWAVSTLMDGEGSLRDIVTATGYSMTPMVLLLPAVAVCSNVLIKDEGVLCSFFIIVAYLWMVILLVSSVMQTHNYSLSKTVGVIFISLLVIVLVVFLLLLGTALLQQMAAFGIDLKDEIIGRW